MSVNIYPTLCDANPKTRDSVVILPACFSVMVRVSAAYTPCAFACLVACLFPLTLFLPDRLLAFVNRFVGTVSTCITLSDVQCEAFWVVRMS